MLGLLLAFVMPVPVFADEDMDKEEAEAYLGEIIEYITGNYIGGDVTVEELVQAALSGMSSVLDDYSQYYTKEQYENIMKSTARTVYRPSFQIEESDKGGWAICDIDSQGYARKAGFRNGDIITEVNGIDVTGFSYDEVNGLLTSSSPGSITLKAARGSRTVEGVVTLEHFEVTTVEIGDLNELIDFEDEEADPSIGYVKIETIGEGTANEFKNAITQLKKNKVKTLILDLRGNTGGYSDQAVDICNLIVPSGVIISTQDKAGNRQSYHSTLKDPPFDKIVVLVDGMTASASEIIASSIQESGIGIVVGETTFGKGVMQEVVEYEDLGLLKITAYEYYTRNGNKINGVGITPDVQVDQILFISKEDDADSVKVKQALEFLGYDTEGKSGVTKSIGRFQAREGLPTTYKLDEATISAINVKIYSRMLKTDRTLLVGYLNAGMEETESETSAEN